MYIRTYLLTHSLSLCLSIVQHGGHPVKYAWKVNNVSKKKWYILFAKSPQVKTEWLEAFKQERLRVKEDRESGKREVWCGCEGGGVVWV